MILRHRITQDHWTSTSLGRAVALTVTGIGFCAIFAASAQDTSSVESVSVRTNPFSRDAAAVQAGRGLYLERCAVCHGQDAKGSMAANLVRSRRVVRGSDSALFRLLRRGIPGTEMPPQLDLRANQVWQIVSYLHNLARPGLQPPVSGNVDAGRELFRIAGCARCHRAEGDGGFWGPALDSIATRKTSAQIRSDVLDPDSVVVEGFRAVVASTTDGRRIEGLLKNQDTFSVQILARDGSYVFLARDDIRGLEMRAVSDMPDDYRTTLSDEDLQHLLAFLDRQRDPFVPFDRGFQNY